MWDEALDAKFFGDGDPFTRHDWDQLLGHVSAVCDLPSYAFSPELIEAYPEAKVILCSRDIDSWYRSFDEAVIRQGYKPIFDYLAYLDPNWTGRLRWLAKKIMKGYFRADTQEQLRDNAKSIFRDHYNLVRRVTPKDRLLEFELSTGWAPLCDFLDMEIPDKPFPRINDTAAMQEKLGIIMRRSVKVGVTRTLLIGGPMCAVLVALAYFRQ
jgi:hypothetical protein